jgi:hypothetical protein
MACEYCKKPMKTDDDFIVSGKYPKHTKIFMLTQTHTTVRPETYGKLYHKECFLKTLEKAKEGP